MNIRLLPWDELKRMKQNMDKFGINFMIDLNATLSCSAGEDLS